MSHEFWNGAALATVFWVAVYAVLIIVYAFRDKSGAEMGNTEAANDRGIGGNYMGAPIHFSQAASNAGDWTDAPRYTGPAGRDGDEILREHNL